MFVFIFRCQSTRCYRFGCRCCRRRTADFVFFLFVIINKHLSHYSAYLRCSLHSITLNKSNWLNNMQVHGGEHSHSASIVALCHWMHTNQLLHFVIYANHKEVFWINAINLNAYKNWIYMRLRLFRPLVCILIKFIIWNVFSIPT